MLKPFDLQALYIILCIKVALVTEVPADAGKICTVCGKRFIPGSNRQQYCPDCSREAARVKHAKRSRAYRERNGA